MYIYIYISNRNLSLFCLDVNLLGALTVNTRDLLPQIQVSTPLCVTFNLPFPGLYLGEFAPNGVRI